ncbi:hypothetical protein B0H11DRAFT_1911166 [Mycena galericulata]|nr:hypothetical protein B0H11DRAFT_1911166 [Mycena galericulata]
MSAISPPQPSPTDCSPICKGEFLTLGEPDEGPTIQDQGPPSTPYDAVQDQDPNQGDIKEACQDHSWILCKTSQASRPTKTDQNSHLEAVCIKAGDDAQDVPSFRTPQASRPTTRPQDSDDLQDVSGFQTPLQDSTTSPTSSGKRIKTAGDVQDGPSFKSKDKTPRLFKPKTSSRKRIKAEDDPRLRTRPQDPSKSPPQVVDQLCWSSLRYGVGSRLGRTSRVPRRHKLHGRQDHETLQTQDVKAEDNAQDLPSVKTQFRRGVSKQDPDTKDYAQDLPNFKTDPPQRGPESKNYPRLEDDV